MSWRAVHRGAVACHRRPYAHRQVTERGRRVPQPRLALTSARTCFEVLWCTCSVLESGVEHAPAAAAPPTSSTSKPACAGLCERMDWSQTRALLASARATPRLADILLQLRSACAAPPWLAGCARGPSNIALAATAPLGSGRPGRVPARPLAHLNKRLGPSVLLWRPQPAEPSPAC